MSEAELMKRLEWFERQPKRIAAVAVLLLLFAVVPMVGANRRGEYDPSQFPLKAHVTASQVQRVPIAEAHLSRWELAAIRGEQAEAHTPILSGPQSGANEAIAGMKGAAAGNAAMHTMTVPRVVTEATINGVRYTLVGSNPLQPTDYAARPWKDGFELLGYDAKQRPQIVKLFILRQGAAETGPTNPRQAANPETSVPAGPGSLFTDGFANGRFWKNLDNPSKIFFVNGIEQGVDLAATEAQLSVPGVFRAVWTDVYGSPSAGHIAVGRVIPAIDAFYSHKGVSDVPIAEAFLYAMQKLIGAPADKLHSELEQFRRTYH